MDVHRYSGERNLMDHNSSATDLLSSLAAASSLPHMRNQDLRSSSPSKTSSWTADFQE
ncbi:hypothetical protein GLOTRDRAFT_100338 [Gloeophyllum trabeum ATCC 11539]|uniref:Uncharacterized protein n=1 Tax=Gloeophyllum trabeum (strain ATCC 11539 / FP-39264 / Madison 617) TaxID=670483 RepID=S7Q5R9_GLOTA|nr:uncharacterized protein GLOTRDRAFT_100338 [Gloeophyllum trabeum ATCC 11539]EPQ54822.1 hypothetical protein GLOTRDRAFT_100338 [Gloeophyllum trabeum ATCC 11539]